MTAPAATEPTRRRTKRRFQILIGLVVFIALLWTAGWFGVRHFVAGQVDRIEARATEEGATLACGDRSLSGFPFRLGVTCTPLAASCPAEEASFELAGLEAIGLVYNPGHVLFAAKGPMRANGPDGTSVDANWSSLESSLRVGISGLRRYSLVSDDLDATLAAPQRLGGPIAVKAAHAEFHLVPDPDDAGTIDVFTALDQFTATIPGQPVLPPVSQRMQIGVPETVLRASGDPVEAWLLSGQPIRIHQFEVSLAGFAAAISGDASVDANGLLSGQFIVRVSALDALPALADRIRPGSGARIAQLIGPISAFLRPVTVDGATWREVPVTVRNGRAAVGFIPLGRIPPLGERGVPPAALPSEPPPAPEPTLPAPPAAEAPAEPPVAAAPAAPAGDAIAAVSEMAESFHRTRRCAIN